MKYKRGEAALVAFKSSTMVGETISLEQDPVRIVGIVLSLLNDRGSRATVESLCQPPHGWTELGQVLNGNSALRPKGWTGKYESEITFDFSSETITVCRNRPRLERRVFHLRSLTHPNDEDVEHLLAEIRSVYWSEPGADATSPAVSGERVCFVLPDPGTVRSLIQDKMGEREFHAFSVILQTALLRHLVASCVDSLLAPKRWSWGTPIAGADLIPTTLEGVEILIPSAVDTAEDLGLVSEYGGVASGVIFKRSLFSDGRHTENDAGWSERLDEAVHAASVAIWGEGSVKTEIGPIRGSDQIL